jgi:hypothetical protein
MVVSFLGCGNKRRSGVYDSIGSELSLACIRNTCIMYMYAFYRRLIYVSGPGGIWDAIPTSPSCWLTPDDVIE